MSHFLSSKLRRKPIHEAEHKYDTFFSFKCVYELHEMMRACNIPLANIGRYGFLSHKSVAAWAKDSLSRGRLTGAHTELNGAKTNTVLSRYTLRLKRDWTNVRPGLSGGRYLACSQEPPGRLFLPSIYTAWLVTIDFLISLSEQLKSAPQPPFPQAASCSLVPPTASHAMGTAAALPRDLLAGTPASSVPLTARGPSLRGIIRHLLLCVCVI